MKKVIKTFLIPIISVITLVPAVAADELMTNPSEVFQAMQPSESARGIIFVENMESLYSVGYIRYTNSPEKNSSGAMLSYTERDWKLCQSWSEEACLKVYKPNLNGYVVLGSCLDKNELGCVESLKVADPSGKDLQLSLIGSSPSIVTDIPEDRVLGIPRSSARPIFRDKNGRLYIVRASMHVTFPPGSRSKPILTFSADVTPVSKMFISEITAPKAKVLPNNVNGFGIVSVVPTREECIAIDEGICFKALKADQDNEYTLKVRVPNGVSGWMNGRLVDPKFNLTEVNSSSQEITVTAKPAKMPIAGGWATYSQLPENLLMDLYPSSRSIFEQRQSGYFVPGPSQGDQGFKEYAAWAPYMKERAITTVTNWSFATQVNSGQLYCVKSGNEIAGVVASNASVYSSRPPAWDAENATLTYQVASPHFDENGKENVGTYTLAIAASTIRCLYNQSTLPPSATVSIGYGSEVVTVATVTIKADSGWVYFSANGFHYSSPTIKVKFAKPTKVAGTSSGPALGPNGQLIQWCAKGYAKKKVMGTNPVCPKGYKKIPAPF